MPLPSLYLVRHGETAWSLSGRHTGRTDLPLTIQGEAMAAALKPWLAPVAFTAVLTSPLLRARRTCALAGFAEREETSNDLREWDYGTYEGRASSDIRREAPGWNLFRDGCPDGESPSAVALRADSLIDRLRGAKGPVALFSHGQFGCVLAVRWIGLAIAEGQHFALDPGSVSILASRPGHPDTPAIILWNAGPAARAGRG